MRKEGIKLYNVIFPIWLIPYIMFFMIETWWVALIVLITNFVIDSLIYLVCMKILKIENKIENYKKGIWKIWIFGFIADIVGGILMLVPSFITGNDWMYHNLIGPIMWNPYESIWATALVIINVLIVAMLIYIFNYKITLKKLDFELEKKKRIATTFAIATAPYLFFIPTMWFYRG